MTDGNCILLAIDGRRDVAKVLPILRNGLCSEVGRVTLVVVAPRVTGCAHLALGTFGVNTAAVDRELLSCCQAALREAISELPPDLVVTSRITSRSLWSAVLAELGGRHYDVVLVAAGWRARVAGSQGLGRRRVERRGARVVTVESLSRPNGRALA